MGTARTGCINGNLLQAFHQAGQLAAAGGLDDTARLYQPDSGAGAANSFPSLSGLMAVEAPVLQQQGYSGQGSSDGHWAARSAASGATSPPGFAQQLRTSVVNPPWNGNTAVASSPVGSSSASFDCECQELPSSSRLVAIGANPFANFHDPITSLQESTHLQGQLADVTNQVQHLALSPASSVAQHSLRQSLQLAASKAGLAEGPSPGTIAQSSAAHQHQLADDQKQATAALQGYQARVADLEQRNADLEQQLQSMMAEAAARQASLQELTEQLASSDAQVAAAMQKLQAKDEELEALRRRWEEAGRELARVREEAVRVREEEARQAQQAGAWRERCTVLEQEAASLQRKLETMAAEERASGSLAGRFKVENVQLSTHSARLEAQLDGAGQDLKAAQAELHSLRTRLHQAGEENQALRQHNAALQQHMGTAEDEVLHLRDGALTTQQEVAALRNHCRQLESAALQSTSVRSNSLRQSSPSPDCLRHGGRIGLPASQSPALTGANGSPAINAAQAMRQSMYLQPPQAPPPDRRMSPAMYSSGVEAAPPMYADPAPPEAWATSPTAPARPSAAHQALRTSYTAGATSGGTYSANGSRGAGPTLTPSPPPERRATPPTGTVTGRQQEMVAAGRGLEGELTALTAEKRALEGEYARMPAHAGRTLQERRRKAQVEARVEEIDRQASNIRLTLKRLGLK